MSEHPFWKGVGLGMAAGAAAGAAMMKHEKAIKRTAQNTVRSMGQLAEDTANGIAQKMPK